MSAVVREAGKSSTSVGDRPLSRRDLARAIASRLRAAQSDDDAADALEALLELARDPE